MTVDALAALRLALVDAMQVKPIRLDDEVDEIGREAKRLERWLGVQAKVTPPRDKAMAAVRDFVQSRDIGDSRQANLVSFGCAERFEGYPDGLIGSGDLFPLLLKQVDDFRSSPRHFRDCYKGILHTYLYYDEETAPSTGRANWRSLKGYLGERSGWIGAPGYQPDWVDAVQGNAALFGADPGAYYGERIFRGEAEAFDGIQRALSITDSSWLVWRVVVGRIEAALRGPDEAVRVAIPDLIALMRANSRAREVGLALLICRYHKFVSPMLHPDLRDFAVEAFGNPWLDMNGLRWNRVDPEARKMIANWLKLSLIEKFFNLLAEDGANDTRRLAFWKTYHQRIDEMFFALGDTARTRQEKDYRDIRKQMEGLRLTLTASPNKDNNAFIMCMGEFVIVEFGEYGNACYVFRRSDLPFAFSGEVAGDRTALKHLTRSVDNMRHVDRGMPWEQRFRARLGELGIRPGKTIERVYGETVAPASTAAARGESTIHTPGRPIETDPAPVLPDAEVHRWTPPPLPSQPFTSVEFRRFCNEQQLEWKDYRPSGGTLKVFTQRRGDLVGEQLAAWGFRFKEKFWWSSRPDDA